MKPRVSLADQLAEIRKVKFSAVPRVRHVMQSLLRSGLHSTDNRRIGREAVLDWARNKWPGLVPANAYSGEPFDYDQPGLRISATKTGNSAIWAFRSEHLDSEQARTWVTEAVIADLDEMDVFGVRNSCSVVGTENPPTTSPAFLREFVAKHDLTDDGESVSGNSKRIEAVSEAPALIRFILSRNRVLPIIAVTEVAPGRYAVDVDRLAQQVQGLAHVFCLDFQIAYELTAHLGKVASVYNGAIRTYYPEFRTDGEMWQHPLVLPQRITEWRDEQKSGESAFRQLLSRQSHLFSVSTPDKLDALPSYSIIRRQLLDRPDKTTADEIEYLRLEKDDAKSKESDWRNLASEYDEQAAAAREEADRLRAQNVTLADALATLRKSRSQTIAPNPKKYDEFEVWIDSNFAQRIFLHSRAVRALKHAKFKNIDLVADSVRLLAESYWPMKTNSDEQSRVTAVAAWGSGMERLKISYDSKSMAENRLGEFKDAYTVSYRIGQKPNQQLGPHLKFGSTKDDQLCMRIYFFWDDERNLVVIGHLPSHLDTRAS